MNNIRVREARFFIVRHAEALKTSKECTAAERKILLIEELANS